MVREVIQGSSFTRTDQKPGNTLSRLDVPTPTAGGTDNRSSPIACGGDQPSRYASKSQTPSAAIGGRRLSARDLPASATQDVEQGNRMEERTSTVDTGVTGDGSEVEPPHTSGTIVSARAMVASTCTTDRPTRASRDERAVPLMAAVEQKHGGNVDDCTAPGGSLAPSPCQVMPWDEELGCDRGVSIVGRGNREEGGVGNGVISSGERRTLTSERSTSGGGTGGGDGGEGEGSANGPTETRNDYPVRPLSAPQARRRTEVKVDGPSTSPLGATATLSVRNNSIASYGGDTSLKGGALTGASMATLLAYMKGPDGELDIFAAARDGQVPFTVLTTVTLV